MHNRRLYLIAGAVAAVIVIGFILSVPHLHDASAPLAAAGATSTTPIVYLHDSYKKGTHAITGEIVAADPCVIVSANASVVPASSSSSPPTILIAVEAPPDTGVCLQEPATTTFSVSAQAAGNAVLTASLNGTDASTSSY